MTFMTDALPPISSYGNLFAQFPLQNFELQRNAKQIHWA